jgi:energy-coupling factor transporter ATP-binding protein EcfA2
LFRAERRVPPYSKSGSSVTLSSSCDNLPEVLSCFFQTRPAGRAAFQDLVTEVLPEVTHVATYPRQLNKDGGPKEVVEIRVFFYGGDPDNEDLSVRLDECGTGLGQVLTICYLLASSKDSRIILVDEPQSFLHPEASRRLMQVFDRFSSRHQFIVSTHSPEIIGAVRNCTLHHVKGGANGSMVRSSSSSEIERVREAFADVGVSLKDIFGFERVLWVEGETEESVFPLVLKAFHPELLAPDLVVKRVFATGDVDSKKCERLLHVYRSIASAAALAPTAVGIVLDREDRNPEKCAEYERSFRKAGVSLTFLPVPLLENWFLDAGALFSALSRDLAMVGAPERVPTLQAIEDELQALIAKAKITPKLRKAGATGSYECWIHGAKVIEELFRPYLVAYNKPRHGRAIATWLIDNDRAKLQSLADFLKRLLSGPRS